MNRKLVVCCTVLAVILFAAIGWFFHHLFPGGSRVSEDSGSGSLTEVLCAVPMDAVMIYQTDSMSDAEGILSISASDYVSVLSSLPGGGAELKGAVSFHSTGKNKLSALMICMIPETVDGGAIADGLLGRCAGVIKKNYNAATIYRSSVPDINFSVFGHYFLCSSSITLIESSMRLLDSGESLLDNPVFVESVRNRRSSESVSINHNIIGKLLSEVARPRYRKYGAFMSHLADWSTFSITRTDTCGLYAEGTFASEEEKSVYMSVLNGQKGDRSDLTEILPHNTKSYTSVRISDPDAFIAGYSTFKSSLGRKKEKKDGALLSAAKDAGIHEIAGASLVTPDSEERVVLINADKPEYFCAVEDGSDTCSFEGVASAVAGKFFYIPDTSRCCIPAPGWVMIGSEKAIEWYLKSSSNVNFFPMADWLSQTPVKSAPGRETVISSMVNLTLLSDTIGIVLNQKYAEQAGSMFSRHNFNYLTMSVSIEDGCPLPRFDVWSMNLERLPSLKTAGVRSAPGQDDVEVAVPEGPFEVLDFRTGKKNTLEQLPDGSLRLNNEKGKGLWTIPFSGKICGCVSQIDYLMNEKLQMLFASGSRLYLLTRLGGDVKPFPVETGKEILYGPAVYDFKSDRNYLLEVLHSDNTVVFYDRDGRPAKGYGVITAPEKIIELPEPVDTGENLCWAVRTSGQTIIVGPDGVPVANFNRKHRLAPDTEISTLSGDRVQVTSAEGKSYILNITTGEFTRQ